MRPVEFVYNLIDRHSPMQEMDRNELRRDASNAYARVKNTIMDKDGKLLDEDKEPKSYKFKQRLVIISESWITRTILALLYMWFVRVIGDWINPPAELEEETLDSQEFEIVQ